MANSTGRDKLRMPRDIGGIGQVFRARCSRYPFVHDLRSLEDPAMYRKRLKANTGCLACRRRRKKCDEHHPVCHNCRRIGSSCTWQSDRSSGSRENMQHTENGLIEIVPATLIRSLSSGYQPFENETQFSLTMRAVPIVLQFLQKPGTTEVWDVSLITISALRQERLRHCLCAYSAIICSSYQPEFKPPAFTYYHRSCAALGQSINFSSGTSHLDDPTDVIASVFLGLFETTIPERLRMALTHFTAAAKMLSQARWIEQDAQSIALARFLAEIILFWTTCLCFLDSGLDGELCLLSTTWYTKLLRPLPMSTVVHFELSPLIKGTYEYHLAALQIALFGRMNCTMDDRKLQVDAWYQHLSDLQIGRFKILQGLPEHLMNFHGSLCIIYTQTLEIMLMKIQHTELCSNSPKVQANVSNALLTLSCMPCTHSWNRIPAWPLMVLYCAVNNLRQLQILDELRASFAPNGPVNYRRWQSRIIEQIKSIRGVNEGHCFKDGLGLLVRKGGITGNFDFEL